jgi:hypothetical protein
MVRYKALEILRNEVYSKYAAIEPVLSPPKERNESNAVDGHFSSTI